MFLQQLHWVFFFFFWRGEWDQFCFRVKPESLGQFHPQPEHCWKWNSVEMDRALRYSFASKGTISTFSLSTPHSLCIADPFPLFPWHMEQQTATTKLQPWEQQHRVQEHLPSFGVPQQGLRLLLAFLRGLACQSRQEVVVTCSQNNYFLILELNTLINMFVEYYGQIQFILGVKAG